MGKRFKNRRPISVRMAVTIRSYTSSYSYVSSSARHSGALSIAQWLLVYIKKYNENCNIYMIERGEYLELELTVSNGSSMAVATDTRLVTDIATDSQVCECPCTSALALCSRHV